MEEPHVIVLEWKEEQSTELEQLCSLYQKIASDIESLTTTKNDLKDKITDLLIKYNQKKVITENYTASYTHCNGSKTLDNKKLVSKLKELNVELTDDYYKISKSYDRLDVKVNQKEEKKTENDPHRIKIDIKI